MCNDVCVLGEIFYTTPWRMTFIVLCCLGAVTVIGLSLAIYCMCNKKDKLRKEKDDIWEQNHDLCDQNYDRTEELKILTSQLDFVNTNWSPVDVTLDPDSAHRNLILSDDGKQVRHGELDQVLSDNGNRFSNWSSVLGNVGFSGSSTMR
ncbi:butyrophilin subfamily 1 member A1-like isoform X3 [Oncorhynchus tshawytscha]|uniref:butyrophilin subfamily 1 member A1-like isoform X3 n=1 Tax=Oncorhynchus tshawytscha TaxID=74940 RepID=UPI001C3CF206|nr:butyrophilin subfamily 1 member A1-like isoform X3 [Oncorhynchus tshawytscha]